MPELPEVEFARRSLERWLRGREVIAAEADRTRLFRGSRPARFSSLHGRLERAERKGKYLLLSFQDNQGVLAHLGMTGKFVRREPGVDEPYSRARLLLDDGWVIHLRDPRMFGRIEPVPADTLWRLPVVSALGVDPLVDGLTARTLQAAVGNSRQPLKVALLDQARVAGLGNIHAAEALYRARLHPSRLPGSLTAAEWRRLNTSVHATLRFALEQEEGEEIEYVEEPGAPNPFLVYGHAGQPCRRCRTEVQSFVQGGRTTHFCPGCQPLEPGKKPLR